MSIKRNTQKRSLKNIFKIKKEDSILQIVQKNNDCQQQIFCEAYFFVTICTMESKAKQLLNVKKIKVVPTATKSLFLSLTMSPTETLCQRSSTISPWRNTYEVRLFT